MKKKVLTFEISQKNSNKLDELLFACDEFFYLQDLEFEEKKSILALNLMINYARIELIEEATKDKKLKLKYYDPNALLTKALKERNNKNE